MATAVEYRLRAEQYLALARQSNEQYAKEALTELAEEFGKAAEKLEHDQPPASTSRRH